MEVIILERLRELHHIIRRSEVFRSSNSDENKVLLQLKETQLKLRCGESCSFGDYTRPFLSILTLPSLTSPYMICALESLKDLLKAGVLRKASPEEDSIVQVISAIIGCKFVSTDLALDSRCYFECVQALSIIVSDISLVQHYDCFENIIQYFLAVVDGSKVIEHLSSIPIVIAAQEALILAAQRLSNYISTSSNSWHFVHDCWLRWIRYCLDVLQTRRKKMWFDQCCDTTPSKRFDHGKPSSYQCSNVVMCFKMLKYLTIDVTKSNNFVELLQRSDVFQMMIIELGFSIIDVGLSNISVDEFRVLMHYSIAIISTMSKSWFPFVQHFVSQHFVKKLQVFYLMLQKQIGGDHPFSAFCSAQSSTLQDSNVDLESLEIIMEGLTDLMANERFLITLYASCDRDFSSRTILRPLVGLIAQCSSLVLTTGTERLGELREVGITVVQSFKQIIHTVGRKLVTEVAEPFHKSVSNTNNSIHTIAAEKFMSKPSVCFKYLYQEKVLDGPVCAKSVAQYLRRASLLPKDKVGCYLGELGKSDTDSIFDTTDFHKAVLAEYVGTFDLQGLDILSCLRIFLSAFRLPGEAQQIDRILIAFSEHCHLHSKDSTLGIVENADVTYLLLFSIIMLNTDRHNPNIRPERKMTVDQFVRNNVFYGKDVNQTRSIPREYLEQIFTSIEEFPIRTEAREFIGVFTIEEWIDQLFWSRRQLHTDYYSSEFVAINGMSVPHSPIQLDFMRCIGEYLLLPCLSVHLYNMLLFEANSSLSGSLVEGGDQWWKERTGRLLDLSCDFLQEVLQIYGKLNQNSVIDVIVLMLYEMCFVKEIKLSYKFVESAFSSVSSEKAVHNAAYGNFNLVFPNFTFYDRLARPSLQRALISLLSVVSGFPDQIGNWQLVVGVLAQLRDFALLPRSIVDFGEDDILPASIRVRFENTLKSQDRSPATASQETTETSSTKKLSTFEYIGEALFGSAKINEFDSEPAPLDLYFQSINKTNARLLAGYNNEIHQMWQDSTRSLRIAIEKTALASLISESKFLSDSALATFLRSIIRAVECKLSSYGPGLAVSHSDAGMERNHLNHNDARDVFGLIWTSTNLLDFSQISYSSAAWLEAVVVEVVLRNRDRFNVCWPIVESHFLSIISNPDHSFSRVSEVQLHGFLKLTWRLLSRESCLNTLLGFLGKLCCVHQEENTHSCCCNKVAKFSPTIIALVDQLMAGIWRLLTHNVEILPNLSLEQWETLFCVIASGSEYTDFAAYKAFEMMSWLLQEPRLVANIPVFSIIAIKPLITNAKCHTFVSEGAVQLMMYVLSRLEPVLQQMSEKSEDISDDEDYGMESTDMDGTTLVWRTCWVPILQAMFAGCMDSRSRVRLWSLTCTCNIFRRSHIRSVPKKLLIDVVVHKFIPVASRLLVDLDQLSNEHGLITAGDKTEFSPSFEDKTLSFIRESTNSLTAESVLIEIVEALGHLMLESAVALSSHPAFDKLWLEVLNFLVSTFEVSRSTERVQVKAVSEQLIKNLYMMLDSNIKFPHKIGLKTVTMGYISTIITADAKQEM